MAPFGSAEDDAERQQSPSANSRTSPAGSSSASDAAVNRQATAGSPNNRLTSSSSASLAHATPTLSPPAPHQQLGVGHAAGHQHSACTCEGARPIVPDPLTGQPVCACQLESSSSASAATSLALLGLHPAGRPPLGALYHAAYHHGHHELAPPPPPPPPPFLASAPGTDQSAFYAAAGNAELKEPLAFNGMAAAAAAAAAASGWPYPSMYYPYDPTLAGYPFGGYGMDLNGSRRKNATRETTATLKAWLSEHKKNPYPTKGEKIMLAIITKMTLTQVSTWFANARRRLKKENKMTWEPKNRNDADDDDDDDVSSDPGDKDPNKRLDGAETRWADGSHGGALLERLHHEHHDDGRADGEDNIDVMLDSDEEELDLLSSGGDSTCLSPGGAAAGSFTAPVVITSSAASTTTTTTNKPKIWSLADMAGTQPSHHHHHSVASIQQQQQQQQQQRDLAAAFPAGLPFGALGVQASAFGIRSTGAPFLAPNNNNNNSPNAPGGGKMFTSFTPSSRLPGASPYLIDPSPYSRASLPSPAAAGLAYPRYPPAQQPASFASHQQQQQRAGNESVTLAYNQLMSSMAAHIQQQQQQQQQQSKGSTNQGVLENLEKLAALASGASSSAKN